MLTPFDRYGGKPYRHKQTKDLTFYKLSDTVKEQKQKTRQKHLLTDSVLDRGR